MALSTTPIMPPISTRVARFIGLGAVAALGACSAEPAQEKPIVVEYTRIHVNSPRRVATTPDTLAPGQVYLRKAFLTSNSLRQIAEVTNHPYSLRTYAYVNTQPRIPVETTLVGDTCYLKLKPALLPDTGSYYLDISFAIDYQPSQRAIDTIFTGRDRIIVRE
jgi:hypothetical protein